MPGTPFSDVISPGMVLLTLGMGLIALFLFTLLIAMVEGVVLTLLKWKPFGSALLASLLVNIASSLVGSVLLIFLQEVPLTWLFIAFGLSVLIEGILLIKIQPATGQRTWLFCLAANLASYLILVLPAYFYSLNR